MTFSELKDAVDAAYGSPEHEERRKKWQRFIKEFTGKWWNEAELNPEDSRCVLQFHILHDPDYRALAHRQ